MFGPASDDSTLFSPDDSTLFSIDVSRLFSPDVSRLFSPDVSRLFSPDVSRLFSPDVSRLFSPDDSRLFSPDDSRLFSPDDSRLSNYGSETLSHDRILAKYSYSLILRLHFVEHSFFLFCCKLPEIYLSIYLSIYKGLRILSRYCSCQDSEFRSAMETSSVDIDKLLSKNFFLWIQCPKISLLLFKDGADLRMESFSCKQSPHTLLLGANGFTLLTTCHEILKLMFFFFNFQT